MADADSNITTSSTIDSSEKSRDALDKAQLKLHQIHGALDCLFVLSCEKYSDADGGLGLYKGSLGGTLDLIMHQVAETRELLGEVQT